MIHARAEAVKNINIAVVNNSKVRKTGGDSVKTIYDTFELNNGIGNPCLGFGTFKSADGKSAEVLKMAMMRDTVILIRRLFMVRRRIWRKRLKIAGLSGKSFLLHQKPGRPRWDIVR